VVHLAIRFVTRDVLRFGGSNFAHYVGFALANVHKKVYDGAESLVRKLGRAYNEAYRPKGNDEKDKTYRQAFLQMVNVLQTVVLTGAAGWAVAAAHPGTIGLVVAAVTALATFLAVYVLWGKVTIESGVGLVGWVSSFAVGISLGAYIHLSAISGYGWLFGLIAFSLNYRFVFPIGYVVVEFIFNRGTFPASVRDALAPIHDALWAKVVAGWTVAAAVMATIGAKIAAAWRRISGGGKK
jgi:hypothetical protein